MSLALPRPGLLGRDTAGTGELIISPPTPPAEPPPDWSVAPRTACATASSISLAARISTWPERVLPVQGLEGEQKGRGRYQGEKCYVFIGVALWQMLTAAEKKSESSLRPTGKNHSPGTIQRCLLLHQKYFYLFDLFPMSQALLEVSVFHLFPLRTCSIRFQQRLNAKVWHQQRLSSDFRSYPYSVVTQNKAKTAFNKRPALSKNLLTMWSKVTPASAAAATTLALLDEYVIFNLTADSSGQLYTKTDEMQKKKRKGMAAKNNAILLHLNIRSHVGRQRGIKKRVLHGWHKST